MNKTLFDEIAEIAKEINIPIITAIQAQRPNQYGSHECYVFEDGKWIPESESRGPNLIIIDYLDMESFV